MSTREIKAALRGIYARGTADEVQQAQRAMAEVEAIERAARVFSGYSTGEYPRIEQLNAATRVMESITKGAS